MSFWDDMELWQKMLFVLAVAIGVTLVYAISRLLLNKRRIRKFIKLDEARKAHLEAGQAGNKNATQPPVDEIPFGIKALEAGIEVEGVVVSRSATPVSSRPNHSQQTLVGSDNESLASKVNGRTSGTGAQMQQSGKSQVFHPTPYVTVPPAVYQPYSATSSVRSSATSLASNAGPMPLDGHNSMYGSRRTSSEPNFQYDATRGVSGRVTPPSLSHPDPATLARLEGRLPSLSARRSVGPPRTRSPPIPGYLPYSSLHAGSPSITPPSRSPTARGSPGSSRTPSPPENSRSSGLPSVHEDESEESCGNSDAGSDGDIRPRLKLAYSTPVVSTVPGVYAKEGDLSALHSHRLSHAAEVGQLTPRPKAPRITSLPHSTSTSYVSAVSSSSDYVLDVEALRKAIPQGDGASDDSSDGSNGRRRANSDPESGWTDPAAFVEQMWDRSVGSGEPEIALAQSQNVESAFQEVSKRESSKPRKLKKKGRSSNKDDVDLEAQL